MSVRRAKKAIAAVIAFISIACGIAPGQPALAETTGQADAPTANSSFATMLNLPVYQWQDDRQAPRAVILAVHGLTMHGTIFDAWARKLAAEGAIVVAPDLRGYGAWYKGGKNTHIDYKQSEKDLCALAGAVRQRHKGLPVFLAGESLGAAMAIRLAAKHSELVDGLILCAPAIKLYFSTSTLIGATLALAKRSHQLDVSFYIKKNMSEDAQIIEEGLTDPLIRKHLSMRDLWSSCRFIASTRQYISKIPAGMPVLVLQGEKDRIVKPSGAAILASNLKATDKTVQLFPQRGHILIETLHVQSDTMKSIASWVDSQCAEYSQKRDTIASNSI